MTESNTIINNFFLSLTDIAPKDKCASSLELSAQFQSRVAAEMTFTTIFAKVTLPLFMPCRNHTVLTPLLSTLKPILLCINPPLL